MSELTQALGLAAPYYNLALVFVVLVLFVKLFRTYNVSRLGHIKSWVLIFIGVLIYVAEAIFTVVRSAGMFHLPYHVNGYFELAIISLFIYALLSKREHIKAGGGIVLASSVKNPSVSSKVSSKKSSKKTSAKKSTGTVRKRTVTKKAAKRPSKKAKKSSKKKTSKKKKSSKKKSKKKKR